MRQEGQSRAYKAALYDQFARIGHALGSPKRLELLDLLAQGEKTVEQLAEHSATPIKSTSAHLRVLRGARLVERRKEGQHAKYRLAEDEVGTVVRALQRLAERRLSEVEAVVRTVRQDPGELEPIPIDALRRGLREGSLTLIDVRPCDEYRAGHIPGAVSVPVAELARRLRELPRRRQIVAYCRGPYCLFADEAVRQLRRHGLAARRLDEGLPEWRDRGFPVTAGQEP